MVSFIPFRKVYKDEMVMLSVTDGSHSGCVSRFTQNRLTAEHYLDNTSVR